MIGGAIGEGRRIWPVCRWAGLMRSMRCSGATSPRRPYLTPAGGRWSPVSARWASTGGRRARWASLPRWGSPRSWRADPCDSGRDARQQSPHPGHRRRGPQRLHGAPPRGRLAAGAAPRRGLTRPSAAGARSGRTPTPPRNGNHTRPQRPRVGRRKHPQEAEPDTCGITQHQPPPGPEQTSRGPGGGIRTPAAPVSAHQRGRSPAPAAACPARRRSRPGPAWSWPSPLCHMPNRRNKAPSGHLPNEAVRESRSRWSHLAGG
jgi:hypothetical protein